MKELRYKTEALEKRFPSRGEQILDLGTYEEVRDRLAELQQMVLEYNLKHVNPRAGLELQHLLERIDEVHPYWAGYVHHTNDGQLFNTRCCRWNDPSFKLPSVDPDHMDTRRWYDYFMKYGSIYGTDFIPE